MLFNSLTFLVFGAVFFAVWYRARRGRNARYLTLVVASFRRLAAQR